MTDLDSPNKERILIVDDEASLRMVITMALKSQGYQVESAQSPSEALQKAPQFQPDLMILDLKMPEMSGVELAGNLREQDYAGDFAICSAFIPPKMLHEAFSMGIVDFIPKPMTADILRMVVKRIFNAKKEAPSGFLRCLQQVRLRNFGKARELCEQLQDDGDSTDKVETLLTLLDHVGKDKKSIKNVAHIEIDTLIS